MTTGGMVQPVECYTYIDCQSPIVLAVGVVQAEDSLMRVARTTVSASQKQLYRV